MSARVHFWELLNPRPTFLCGKEPEQGKRNVAAAMRVTAGSVAWYARHGRSCRNCLRVASARLRASPPPGESKEGGR